LRILLELRRFGIDGGLQNGRGHAETSQLKVRSQMSIRRIAGLCEGRNAGVRVRIVN
jgi:hypothetical protein